MAEDIVTLTDFKARTSRLFRKLREEQRPLVITRNGKPAAVLITPEEFDRICERNRFSEAVSAGLADSAAGRLIDDEALEAELDAEFGPMK
jgi:prevent-host-death family protein